MEEFTVRSGGWSDLPTSTGEWDEGAARAALDSWAGDDMGKYARGFLWFDAANRDLKTAYKFPIAKPVDGKLTIFLRAVNNADSRLNQANIPAADKQKIQGILNRIQARYHEMSLVASAAPVHPPKSWFAKPPIGPRNKITVTDEGRVYGWAAPSDVCHRGALAASGTCITPSTMARTFAHFETGTTKTAEGELIDTGPLTWDTTHAPSHLRASAAKAHYEHTGTAFADVKVGWHEGGIWFSGAMRPTSTESDFQKARQSPLSVDARRIGSDLALIDLLAVNRPGFPVLTAGIGDEAEDLGVDVYFEGGVQMTLIASWAPDEFDAVVAPSETVVEAPDEDCGCPGMAEKLGGYKPLLLPEEMKARQAQISGYAKI